MGILNLFPVFYRFAFPCGIFFPVISNDIFFRPAFRFLRNPGGIRTQVSDDTYRAIALDLNPFI